MTNDKRNQFSFTTPRTRRYLLRQVASIGAALGAAHLIAPDAEAAIQHVNAGCFTTHDGVTLRYLEAGRGKPLVMIPGWSQTAIMFAQQIEAFSRHHHVIALDMRGHGDSDKPSYGYRIARLASDLHEFLEWKRLRRVTLAGHSMGCSVIWSYWDNFGPDKIDRLILIDQCAAITAWPDSSEQETRDAGAGLTGTSLYEIAASLRGPDGIAVTEALLRRFFTSAFPADDLAWVLQQNLKFPRACAAQLLVDHAAQDWRDLIQRLDVPTLVIGGEASHIDPASQAWIAAQIPGAELVIFEEAEGGSHFAFLENPELFNRVVLDFIG
ncbi:alpha/beta hydrolase [Sorangium sp. So ce302]|uniref:alpha/beta fold hydrolase n=1 Tax=Sorangium sp. So ce302 TaxID=3133297 RepID=UPI003F615D0B